MFNESPLDNFESKYEKYTKEIWISLKNMTKKDNGTYSCYFNETTQKAIDIMIRCILLKNKKRQLIKFFNLLKTFSLFKDGPIMLSEAKNITVDEFEAANLICSIEKYPKPNILWKNLITDEIIDSNLYTYINSKTVALLFEHVTRNNSGFYSCFDQENPNLSTQFGITVKCNKRITRQFLNI